MGSEQKKDDYDSDDDDFVDLTDRRRKTKAPKIRTDRLLPLKSKTVTVSAPIPFLSSSSSSSVVVPEEQLVVDLDDDFSVAFVQPGKESWKTLMGRMQSNQQKNINPKKTGTTGSNKGTGSKKTVRQGVNTTKGRVTLANLNSSAAAFLAPSVSVVLDTGLENPPKKLKLEPEEKPFVNSNQSDSKDSISPKKVASIFLTPHERRELKRMEESAKYAAVLDSGLQEALQALSVEPSKFSSSSIGKEDHFVDNVVLLHSPSDAKDTVSNASSKRKQCPFYKKLPGTRFSVDAFNYGVIPGVEVYFLSHFHSDHYIGLTKNFSKTLICSPPTANLVKMKLNVDDKHIRTLQINKEYVIDGVEVSLINANHCPGSVMFLFRLPNGTVYFHTGDFRFTEDMLNSHFLQGLRVDCLYLDTTYCDPQYNFPTQMDSITELVTVIKKKLEVSPKTLVVCGSYVIGKERVYFSLAEVIKAKVFMNYDKRRVIHALENPRYTSYLADKEDAACIHVHQMFAINPKFLSEYLASRLHKYTHIIGVKPTGWQFSSSGEGLSVNGFFNNTVTMIGVPYSEHSSFSELKTFVQAIKPLKVQPTVNVGSPAKRESMMVHIDAWLK